jgi:hypothetical protein
MRRITFATLAVFWFAEYSLSQSASCADLNGYVASRNIGGTGYYNLINGYEEKAAQTYYFSGPGKISQVNVYGNFPSVGGVPLRISIFNVDANGRPTTQIAFADEIFWSSDNAAGFITASLPNGGAFVNGNFAVGVTLRNAWPYGNTFQLRYTGDGEGLGDDLSSLAGSSTGNNWSSALNNFNKDGDFYLVPKMTSFLTSDYSMSNNCINAGGTINFTNNSSLSLDSMFNRIGLNNYSGAAHYYTWNFGDGSPVAYTENVSHQFVNPGAYTVTLTCTVVGWEGTCTSVKALPISVGLSVNATAIVNNTCFGGNSGSFVASGGGGISPYQYSISNPSYQIPTTFSGLQAGNYTLSIKDANGCIKTSNVTITQPASMTFSTLTSTNATCGSMNGTITAAASGGVGAMQYKLNNGTFQSSGNFTGLSSGMYSVTAKDANGCLYTDYVAINNQNAPSLSEVSVTNSSCSGGSNGTIVLQGTGGSGILQYSINNGSTYQTSGSFLGLQAGTYTVVVKDASNCKFSEQITINQPAPISIHASTVQPDCFGGNNGQIVVNSATGGVGTLTYSLNNINFQSSQTFPGLTAGNYTIYTRDAASCIQQSAITLTQPNSLSIGYVANPALCNAEGDGSLQVNVSGGTAPFLYSIGGGNFQPTSVFNFLTSGNYPVTVEDAKGCTVSTNVSISQPAALTTTTTATNSTCGNNNGGLLAIASGGSGNGYQYSLDGINFNSTGSFTSLMAGNYYITVRDASNCKTVVSKTIYDANGPTIGLVSTTNIGCNNGSDGSITINGVTGGTGALQYSINGVIWTSANTFTNLGAGTYGVYVRDVNGCIGTSVVTLTQPSPFSITSTVNNATCHYANNGSLSVYAAGGSGTLAYSIDNGLSYQSSNTFNNLTSGSYTIIVRDAASCTGQITSIVSQPSEILFLNGILNVSCNNENDGSISVYAFGGTGTLNYSLDGINYQSTNAFNNLSGGTYTVFVKDANGCIKTNSVNVIEPAQLLLNSIVSNISCSGGNNGVIDLTVSGGVGGNEFTWSNNATSEDIFGLEAGAYTVIVEDNNGCTSSGAYVLTEPLMPIVLNGVVTPTTGNTGEIDATVTGGTSPYTFSWSNGEQTEDIIDLTPGNYTLTITDANNCETSEVFTVEDITSVDEHAENSNAQVVIYPNPATDELNIQSVKDIIQSVGILDVNGKLINTIDINQTVYSLDLRQLNPGMYFLQINNGEETTMKRFSVVK